MNLDFTEARDSEWQWSLLGHIQVCTSLQSDNRASTPPLSFFTGQMPFLPPIQQRQSTEGNLGSRKPLKCILLQRSPVGLVSFIRVTFWGLDVTCGSLKNWLVKLAKPVSSCFIV